MTTADPRHEPAGAYAIGALDGAELAAFEAHLSGCAQCESAVAEQRALLAKLPQVLDSGAPGDELRLQVFDLTHAPAALPELASLEWEEVAPGIRLHLVKADPDRHMRAYLAWAQPGARTGLHRHHGDENILVLRGALRDERGRYGPGDICRSRAGSVHTEEVLGDEECVCYVVYYGQLEMLEAPAPA